MRHIILTALALNLTFTAVADEIAENDVRNAIAKAIPWLEKGAAGSSKENQCFTCHTHALPILAIVEARQHGLEIDEANLKAQLNHTLAHLERGKQQYIDGKGQGGQVLTAGYALWALDDGHVERNETTDAVIRYVLNHQKDKGHWVKNGRRPPSDGSPFTANYVALRTVVDFDAGDLSELKTSRVEAAEKWLLNTKPKDTEDAVFQLKALHRIESNKDAISGGIKALTAQQKQNGGWAQTPDMEADAYATGTVLATLLKEGQLLPSDPVAVSGVRYLLDSQQENGTWHVVTRADGFQPYYETGFPYDEDQFLSTAASSWATIALLRTLPEAPSPSETSIAK
jgi:hypothetical protein